MAQRVDRGHGVGFLVALQEGEGGGRVPADIARRRCQHLDIADILAALEEAGKQPVGQCLIAFGARRETHQPVGCHGVGNALDQVELELNAVLAAGFLQCPLHRAQPIEIAELAHQALAPVDALGRDFGVQLKGLPHRLHRQLRTLRLRPRQAAAADEAPGA